MIVLDIETKSDKRLIETYLQNLSAPKNYKDQAKIDEWLENKKAEVEKELAIDSDYATIACIGIKIDDQSAKLIEIEDLNDLVIKHKIITFNGKGFDLPVLTKNALKLGLKEFPYTYFREMKKRWNALNHIDLMETISDGKDWKSLDTYLQIYLGIKKTPIDFTVCSQEELEKHCLEDVENTYKLFKFFEPSL